MRASVMRLSANVKISNKKLQKDTLIKKNVNNVEMAQILIYTLSHYHITIQKHCILKSKSNYLAFVSKSCCTLKSKGIQVKNQFFLIK